MPNEETIPVEGIRLRPSDVKRLQVLARVLETSVVGLIRKAVENYIRTAYDWKSLRATVNLVTPGPARSFLEQWIKEAKGCQTARKPRAVRKLTPVHKHKL